MAANLADILMPQLPMEKTHQRLGIKNPFLKTMTDPFMLGSLATGGVGLGAAVGRRAARKTAAETVPELLTKLVARSRARSNAPVPSPNPITRRDFLGGVLGDVGAELPYAPLKSEASLLSRIIGPEDVRGEAVGRSELLRRIASNRQSARSSQGVDPDLAHSFDFGKDRDLEAVELLSNVSRKLQKTFPERSPKPLDVSVDFPAQGFARKTQLTRDRPMRYLMSRHTPIWDFDMPDAAHQSEQVRAYHLGDVLESLRRSGAGAGTLYRTPGGARYVDKATSATPHDMYKAGGLPDKIDPYYEGLISQPHQYRSWAPDTLEQSIEKYQTRGTPSLEELQREVRTWQPSTHGQEPLLGLSTQLNPSYAARLSPKHGRQTDYVAQPMLEMGRTPAGSRTTGLVQRLHDQPASLAMRDPARRQAFLEDVASDLPTLDKPDREAVVRYIMNRYGVPLSVATLLAGAAQESSSDAS